MTMTKAKMPIACILARPTPILSGSKIGIKLVGRVGFEPTKAQGQQIYSLPRLTASVSTRFLSGFMINKLSLLVKLSQIFSLFRYPFDQYADQTVGRKDNY